MLGVRLKTWVKTHLGRERNQTHHRPTSYLGGGAPFPKPSALSTSRSPYNYRDQAMNNADKSTSSTNSNSQGLMVNGSMQLSSPDTGYSTDGLSNSNLLNSAAGTNSPSSVNTASTPSGLSLHQYATAKKREWFLQNTPSIPAPPVNFQFKDTGNAFKPPSGPIKPTRIQTNPWYNPKSKRLSASKALQSTPPAHTQDNHKIISEHPRHSTCTTITADSGEGSLDSQKSSPRVSFSSSSLESYKPDKQSGTGTGDWKGGKSKCNKSRYGVETKKLVNVNVNDCSTEDQIVVNTKSPYKGWYQPPTQVPVLQQYDNTTLLSSKLSSFTPYFVHTNHSGGAAAATRKQQESLSPNNERSSKRRAFGFLKKLFRKGSSKKGRNDSSSSSSGGGAEVSLHDLYYHQNPIPAPAGGTGAGAGTGRTASSVASPYFFTELHQPPPPSVPPRVSSFLTPTPNAFRRRTVSDASTSMSMARRNLTPNLGYTYREPLPLHHHHQPAAGAATMTMTMTRTPVLLSRQYRDDDGDENREKTENRTNHDRDLEYEDKYRIHNAYAGAGPKLSSVYCTPSRQVNAYASYYSSPPQRHGFSPSVVRASARHGHGVAPFLHTNTPIFHHNHNNQIHQRQEQQPSCSFVAVNQTPSKMPIVNRKLILQSPTPFTNNSSYSPIHRVAVLKSNTNTGTGTGTGTGNSKANSFMSPSINRHNNANGGHVHEHEQSARVRRPEYFSPQQNHSSKYHQHQHQQQNVASQSYNNGNRNNPPFLRERQNQHQHPSATFFSPQLQPAAAAVHNDPRRRCFQYISSSNQNSPILSAHRQAQTSKVQPQQQLTSQMLFNRLSPVLRAPAAFANHHRVYPIKNYSPMPMGGGGGSKLVQDSYVLSSSSGSSSSIRSPAISARNAHAHTHARTSPAAAIDKIYEEIDDAEAEEDDDEEDALTTAATAAEDDEVNDDLSTNPTDTTTEEDAIKLQTSGQQYSDEGDGLGGDYYQFDYDSSLLSTTEELDETSHSHSQQDQPSTASTSTLLKQSHGHAHDDQLSQLQPFSPYAIVDKRGPLPLATASSIAAAAAAASVDISPTTKQLLEIENDLRFCRLIAEAQTLLRELETTTTSTLARNGLETYHHQGQRHSGSSTSLRGTTTTTTARQQSFGSNNGSNNTYRRNQRSMGPGSGSRVEECPQSDPLRRKAYECWALRRLQQELAGCCASPLAFRHNLVPRQQFLQMQQSQRRPPEPQSQSQAMEGTNL